MLTRIVQPSPALETFLDSLHLNLSQPQREHLLHLVDGLLVCDERKDPGRLAAAVPRLHRSLQLGGFPPDQSLVRRRRCAMPSAAIKSPGCWPRPNARGLPKVLYVNLDDSLGKKDKQTSHIEPVDWFHDHNESTPRQPRYHKAFCYLECTLRAGDLTATVDLRLYLRDKTVRRLNRHRSPEHRLHFRSKFHLARDILESLKPLLPAGWTIYVQFDSWYASERLLKIRPSSRLARRLRPEEQPEVAWATPQPVRSHLTAQAVHAACA